MPAGDWKYDTCAVSVIKDGTIVGHLLQWISCTCTLFMRRGGTIGCQVTGRRKYSSDLQQRSTIQRGKYFACSLQIIQHGKFPDLWYVVMCTAEAPLYQ